MSAARAFAVSLLVLFAGPAIAEGATVARTPTQLNFTAAAGEANDVTVSPAGADYVVTDTGVGALTDGDGAGGCVVVGNQAACPAAGVTRVSVTAGDLADTVDVNTTTADVLDGGTGADALSGGQGGDTIVGRDGNDVLNGEDGNDALRGSTGADVFNGGAGTGDLASYSDSTVSETVNVDNAPNDGSADDGPAGARDNVRTDVEHFRGGSASDRYTGSAVGNVIQGEGGNDSLVGGPGNDVFHGGDGNDALRGQTGADVYNGNAGADLASYSDSTETETVNIDGAANDGSADDGPAGARDLVRTDVENLRGGGGGDALTGSTGANVIEGLGGNDSLVGGVGDDVLRGGDGNDALRGQTGADQLGGGPGSDVATYVASLQREILSIGGTPGDDGSEDDGPFGARDTIDTDVENLRGGSGHDSLFGDGQNNRLEGGPGEDQLTGGEGHDLEQGGDGHDTFFQETAANGADTLDGQGGVDVAQYLFRTTRVKATIDGVADDGEDAPPGGPAEEGDNVAITTENVAGGTGDDELRGNAAANFLFGHSGADLLHGEGGADNMRGEGGTDGLFGGAGNDWLEGGLGADTEQGGPDDDLFLVESCSPNCGDGGDDVSGGDGVDVANFSLKSTSLYVNLDDVANDGEDIDLNGDSEEDDNYHADIENLVGGSASDALFGNAGPNDIAGRGSGDGIRGLGGNDVLRGEADGDLLEGGTGDDSLNGGAGNDSESGGFGDDLFTQGNVANGADEISCGSGGRLTGDRVQYAQAADVLDGRLVRVAISLDNVANDGEDNDGDGVGEEGDNIRPGCEQVVGGTAGDLFSGGAGDDSLVGMQGDDTLIGNDGNDDLQGRQGDDLLFAIDPSGPAADTVDGGTGEEVSGDTGQWDAGVDTIINMEDPDPG